MKKKVLIKEGELDNLVVNILKEINSPQSQTDSEQLSFDFDDEEELSGVITLAMDKYNDIVSQLNTILSTCNDLDSQECYDQLDNVYGNIFNTWKELDKLSYTVGDSSQQEEKVNEIMDDFNMLENNLVEYLEIYREYKNLKTEFDNSKQGLMDIIKKGV
jgi:hypothetical protein